MKNLLRNKKGSALVEYSLLIAGVALVGAAAVSIFGHKTSDLIAATAATLPGAHDDDNGAIVSGALIETARDATTGAISLDLGADGVQSQTARLGNNLFGATANTGNILGENIVVEAE